MVCATNVYLLTVGTLWLALPHFWSTEKCESQPTDFRLLPNILIKIFIFYFLDLPCNCGNAGHSLLERFAPRKKCFKRKVFKLKQKISIFCTKSRDKNLIIWVCACTVDEFRQWNFMIQHSAQARFLAKNQLQSNEITKFWVSIQ